MRTVTSLFTNQDQSNFPESGLFDGGITDMSQGAPSMDPIFGKVNLSPQLLDRLQNENRQLLAKQDRCSMRIDHLTRRVDELMDCLELRNAQVEFLQHQLESSQRRLAVQSRKNSRTLKSAQPVSSLQEMPVMRQTDRPALRICLKLMQYLLLGTLGYLVAIFVGLLLAPEALGLLLWDFAQVLWQPTAAAFTVIALFAWGAEAI